MPHLETLEKLALKIVSESSKLARHLLNQIVGRHVKALSHDEYNSVPPKNGQ